MDGLNFKKVSGPIFGSVEVKVEVERRFKKVSGAMFGSEGVKVEAQRG